MNAQDLLEYLRTAPFEPFRIHLTDGTSYEIRHPEMVKVTRTRAEVFFHKNDEPNTLVMRKEGIALLHINRVEMLNPEKEFDPSHKGTNGTPGQ